MKPKLFLSLAPVLIYLFASLNLVSGQDSASLPAAAPDLHSTQARAERGDTSAQHNLAVMYLKGEGIEQDYTKAAHWFGKAAEQGDADSMYNLAVCYDQGVGVSQNITKAIEWFQKADKADYPQAAVNLGVIYYKGQGVVQDSTNAFKWFRRAADQGFPTGCDYVGLFYENGVGVEKDLVEAYKWFTLASRQGYESATRHKDLLVISLTSDQISEADRRANSFIPISKNLVNVSGSDSSLTNGATAPKTMEQVQAEIKTVISNAMPEVTNRLGAKYAPAAANMLGYLETNVVSGLTNSGMAEMGGAVKYLLDLKKKGSLPGMSKDSHGSIIAEPLPASVLQAAQYPFSITFNVVPTDDPLTNHYTLLRPASDAEWRLEKAWRTDAQAQTVVEWPVK